MTEESFVFPTEPDFATAQLHKITPAVQKLFDKMSNVCPECGEFPWAASAMVEKDGKWYCTKECAEK